MKARIRQPTVVVHKDHIPSKASWFRSCSSAVTGVILRGRRLNVTLAAELALPATEWQAPSTIGRAIGRCLRYRIISRSPIQGVSLLSRNSPSAANGARPARQHRGLVPGGRVRSGPARILSAALSTVRLGETPSFRRPNESPPGASHAPSLPARVRDDAMTLRIASAAQHLAVEHRAAPGRSS
jgi:hypothetical protein